MHLSERTEDFVVIAYHSNLPFGLSLERGVVDVAFLVVIRVVECGNITFSALALCLGDGAVVDDMDNVGHIIMFDTLGFRSRNQFSFLCQQQIERRLIDLSVIQRVAQHLRRHIESEQSHDISVLVVDGDGITDHFDSGNAVKVRVEPNGGIRRDDLLEIGRLRVVVTITCNLLFYNAVMVPIGVGLVYPTLFRIIVGHKGCPASCQVLVVFQHPLHDAIQRIRRCDVAFQIPEMSPKRVLGNA